MTAMYLLSYWDPPLFFGTYHGVVAPDDIAATFESLLRVNRPSTAVGRILTEAIGPEGEGVT